jgi:pimeloyl-ACP methyl ester carboxylesterase
VADAIPQRIDRVVLTSTCFFLTEDQEKIYESVMKFIHLVMHFRAPWMADLPLLPRMMARRYFHHIPGDRQLLKQGLRDYLELDYATAIASSNEATSKAIPEAGARLQAPALLIACRQDQVMPVENVDYTAETIPNCTVRWMDQCGHMPMVEKPTEYLGHLRDFLRLNGGEEALQ